jgi:hypothetical protein
MPNQERYVDIQTKYGSLFTVDTFSGLPEMKKASLHMFTNREQGVRETCTAYRGFLIISSTRDGVRCRAIYLFHQEGAKCNAGFLCFAHLKGKNMGAARAYIDRVIKERRQIELGG